MHQNTDYDYYCDKPSQLFSVNQIDHVELCVPDRWEAASWYERVLGLKVAKDLVEWADNPCGPLMIETAHGGTKLALFERTSAPPLGQAGYRLVAFRVSADGFLRFCKRIEHYQLLALDGTTLTRTSVVDHGLALSVYFLDPYGHAIEVTTYKHERERTEGT